MGKYPYVELMEATAVSVEPVGRESRWNLDGELLENNHLSAQVLRGHDWGVKLAAAGPCTA